MTHLILVRHGKTDWNKDGRVQGQLDIPLNSEGKEQIQAIISGLANLKGIKRIDALYSSRLSRSVETASGIGRVYGLKIGKLGELNELNQGVWQGLLEKQIKVRHKKLYSIWKTKPSSTKPPKGEAMAEAYTRVMSAVKKLVKRHTGKTVCIVTHEIVSAIIKCYYKKIEVDKIWENIPKNATLEMLEIR